MDRWYHIFHAQEPTSAFRVGFLIAGVQKAGTFSLFRLLEQHPQIGLSSSKEVHFFDDEINVDWCKPDYNRYHRWFPRHGQRIFGEATPIYLYWPSSLARIKSYNPNIKLILLFRDPIGRAYSAWCHQRRKGREKLSFSDAIRRGRARITGLLDASNRHFSYVERGFYAAQLNRALNFFSASNILVLDSRQLSLSPSVSLKRVAEFLDLDAPSGNPMAVHANRRSQDASTVPPTPDDIELLVDLFGSDIEAFASLVDFPIEGWPTCRVMRGYMSPKEAAGELAKPGFAGLKAQKPWAPLAD